MGQDETDGVCLLQDQFGGPMATKDAGVQVRRKNVSQAHNPDQYPCANPACKRATSLAIKHNSSSYPTADTPREEIHRVVVPTLGGFVLLCASFGHFTVVSNF